MLIAFSAQFYFDVRLPAGEDSASLLGLTVQIRDSLDCVTVWNLSAISVTTDSAGISDLLAALQMPTTGALSNNPLVQLLSSGNQNTVGQIVGSLSQEFNKMNAQSLQNAVSSESDDVESSLMH